MMQANTSVILIEDDAGVREAIGSLLRSSGAAVVSFPSAEAFLGAASHDGVGCLIIDVNLPGMSGFDLLRELPATQWRSVPVVFITARADPDGRMRQRAMLEGARALILKPFLDDVLLAAVLAALAT